ncbi:YebO family protein [Pseudocitrobacter faecalis]|uniref:YebO family protein n=1 Tax=Pseudocitrobacter faecalis TaxID=1398493 RepID=UPI003BA33D86
MYSFEHFYIILLLSWVITIAIAFYVIRGATRANEQVELLEKIIANLGGNNEGVDALSTPKFERSDEEYLEEARKHARLMK